MSGISSIKIVNLEVEQVKNVLEELLSEFELLSLIPQRIGFELNHLPQSFQKYLVKQRELEENFTFISHRNENHIIGKKNDYVEKIKKNTRRLVFILKEHENIRKELEKAFEKSKKSFSVGKFSTGKNEIERKDYGQFHECLKDLKEIFNTQIMSSHEVNKINKRENEKHLENYKKALTDIVAVNRLLKQERDKHQQQISSLEEKLKYLQREYDKVQVNNLVLDSKEHFNDEDEIATKKFEDAVKFLNERNNSLRKEIQKYKNMNRENEKALQIIRLNEEKKIHTTMKKREETIKTTSSTLEELKTNFFGDREEISDLKKDIKELGEKRGRHSERQKIRTEKMKKNLLLIQSFAFAHALLKQVTRNQKEEAVVKLRKKKIKKRKEKRKKDRKYEMLYYKSLNSTT